MANFKAQIRIKQLRTDGTTNIKIRLTHKGKTRYIPTDHYVKPTDFDPKVGAVLQKHANAMYINIQLRNKINSFEKQILKLEGQEQGMSIKAILDLFKTSKEGEVDFYLHLDNYVSRLRKAGQDPYARTIEQTKDRLKDYSSNEKLAFHSLNYIFLMGFESFYKSKNMSVNTIAFHCRNIRTIFNDAIKSDLINQDAYPFKKYKIKKEQTQHKNLEIKQLAKLFKYEPASLTEERAKDLIFLSFFLLGINFIDLILAKKNQVNKGRLDYTRHKTKKQYLVLIPTEAKKIISKYEGDEYLLKIYEDKIRTNKKKDRKTPLYKDVTDQTNETMKKIFDKCGYGWKGSTYYMRHSWASLVDELEISKTVISLAMGHGPTSVTDTYIYTDIKRVDAVNKKLIEYLQKSL